MSVGGAATGTYLRVWCVNSASGSLPLGFREVLERGGQTALQPTLRVRFQPIGRHALRRLHVYDLDLFALRTGDHHVDAYTHLRRRDADVLGIPLFLLDVDLGYPNHHHFLE